MIDNLLVCIGAQKAGTSWLHTILSKDKRFSQASNQFPNVKEIHYFDFLYDNKANHINKWRAHYLIEMIKNRGDSIKPLLSSYLHGDSKEHILSTHGNKNMFMVQRFFTLTDKLTDEWYIRLLRCNQDQKFSLDITPDYSVIGEKGFRHLKKISKNLKIIFIMRNPVERAWSGVLQGKKGTDGGIKAFVENGLDNIDELYKECTVGLDVGRRTNYKKTLDDLYAAGLDENLKILFYDDISLRPEKLIDDIYDFIGLNNHEIKNDKYVSELTKKVYATEGKVAIPEKLEEKLKIYYKYMLQDIIELYQVEIPNSWLEYYEIKI